MVAREGAEAVQLCAGGAEAVGHRSAGSQPMRGSIGRKQRWGERGHARLSAQAARAAWACCSMGPGGPRATAAERACGHYAPPDPNPTLPLTLWAALS
jgi:hypothetical protein